MVNKKRKKEQIGAKLAKCAFQVAIENTDEVKNGFCVGKQAIKSIDRSKVVAANNNKLQGSLDIDSQVKAVYPNEPRWDYALSYDDRIYFFEVHPAETSAQSRTSLHMGTIWSIRNFTNSTGKDETVCIWNNYCQYIKFEVRCYGLGLISN